MDQLGVWKLVELDGKKVESRSRDFTVYETREAAEKVERDKLDKTIAEKRRELKEFKELIEQGKMKVTRVEGKDRYETALKASRYAFEDGSKYAVIATGENFIDGLVGGSLTAQVEAPFLLVRKNAISKEVLNEIKRLKPEEIFILGGEGAVSEKVEKDIKTLGITVERLAGKDRVEIAEKINEKREALLPKAFAKKHVAMVSGTNFPDALTAAPLIGEMAKLGDSFYSLIPYMKGHQYPKVDLAIGGEKAVPIQAGDRIDGKDRFQTARLVGYRYTNQNYLEKNADTIIVVNARNYPDGLTAASLASTQNGVVLLTDKDQFSKYTFQFLESYRKIKNVVILGGEAAVGENIEKFYQGKYEIPEWTNMD